MPEVFEHDEVIEQDEVNDTTLKLAPGDDAYLDPETGMISWVQKEGDIPLVGGVLPKSLYPELYKALCNGADTSPWGETETAFNIPDLRNQTVVINVEEKD